MRPVARTLPLTRALLLSCPALQLKNCEPLKESDVKLLCDRAVEVLVEEANVQRVDAPVTICERSAAARLGGGRRCCRRPAVVPAWCHGSGGAGSRAGARSALSTLSAAHCLSHLLLLLLLLQAVTSMASSTTSPSCSKWGATARRCDVMRGAAAAAGTPSSDRGGA